MVSDAILAAYQRIIQRAFKTVKVSAENGFSDEYGVFVNAIGIPNDKRSEFSRFILDTLAPEIEKQGFEFIGVIPYSMDEAESKYPDIWAEIQREETANAFRTKISRDAAKNRWQDPIVQSEADLSEYVMPGIHD